MPDNFRHPNSKGDNLTCTEQPRAIYLGLGANLGDRKANLAEARRRIEAGGLAIIRVSSVYETEPLGFNDQPWFLNQVIEVRADSSLEFNSERAAELLFALLEIERQMGRHRAATNGPRVIDIDLLLYGEMIIDANPLANAARVQLTVPHPRMHLRRFVLEPLCELAPQIVHPQIGKTIADLLAYVEDNSTVNLYKGK